ncbi:MAG TPA: isoprenylcysteine carboxylmethyltransferase family protein [Gammaproteobacteria bacterium]|nr:isoprenylcysteine carboxylmethyltransferase family protein [Gammaproteobacteria bacterium]
MADTVSPSLIVRIPTPIWLLGLIGAALLVDVALKPPAVAQYRPAGIVLLAAGLLFSVWAAATFRRHKADIRPSSSNHPAFVTDGPFRVSRNPMYAGSLGVAVGAALLAGTWLMWLVPIVLFLLQSFVIIPFEERSMRRAFGEAYDGYSARVRRWI